MTNVSGDLEISGYWYHLDTKSYFNTIGRDGAISITVTGQNNYSVVNEAHSRSWAITSGIQEWLVYGGSYSLTANSINDDIHELDKLVIKDTDFNDQEREFTFYPDSDVLSAQNAQTLASGGTLSGTDHRYICCSVANDKYNNHNRVDKAISFVNSEMTRHMVLRAYYYVWNKTTGAFEITDPVYFYLYDIGNSVSSKQ